MMKKHILLFISVTILAGACAQSEKAETPANVDALSGLDPKESETQLTAAPQNDLYSDGATKLIKTAHYRFQVDNVKMSTDAIVQSIRKYPAYISSSSLHLENPVLENKLTIRVKTNSFRICLTTLTCRQNSLIAEILLQMMFQKILSILSQDL